MSHVLNIPYPFYDFNINMNFEDYAKKITSLKPAREVFVACLDVLGFSGFACEKSHDDLVAMYQSYVRPNVDYSLAEVAEQVLEDSPWLKEMESSGARNLAPMFDNVTLNCISASDSIILSTSGSELRDFMRLVTTVRNFMARSFFSGFPLRGAITQGMLTLDWDLSSSGVNIIHHQILGSPIVVANNLEKGQNWSGCAIHHSVIDKIGPKIVRLQPVMIAMYDVPMKNKNNESFTISMPVVNWVHGISDNDKAEINTEKISLAFAAHGKKISTGVQSKIDNTIKFFDEMSSHPVYRNEMSYEDWWNFIEKEFST